MWYLDKEKNCWTNGTVTLPAGSPPPVTNSQMKKEARSDMETGKLKDMGSMWSASSNNSSNSNSNTNRDKKKPDIKKQTSAKSGVGKARLW